MKLLKLMLFAIIMVFTFAGAKAQVVVRAHIGPGYHHHYHHWHHRHWHHWHRY